MTVLRAPLGFGKTTAVTSWLQECRRRHCGPGADGRAVTLHTLSAPPTSSRTFWTGLAADLCTSVTATGQAAPGAAAGPGSDTADGYAQVRDLVARLTAPLLLIVDGLEAEVSTPADASPVGGITTEIVDLLQLSPHLDVLLTCRPYGPLATDAIFGPDAQILDAAAFTLSAGDTLDLADAFGAPLTLPQAYHLQGKVWGWPALTCAALAALAESRAGYEDTTWEAAGDFLSSLDPQDTDPEVAYFLRQVCLLDPLTGPLAERLTGSVHASRALADLEQAGLARSYLRDGERHYTLLPAVVRAIRTRPAAAAEHAPAHRHAATMFRSVPEQALRHGVLAQDWDLVLSIAEGAVVPLVLDHPLALQRALGQVPPTRLRDNPGLFELHTALARFDDAVIALPTGLPPWGAQLGRADLHRSLTRATAQVIALRACHQDLAACELVDRCAQVLLRPGAATSGTAVPLFLLHAGIARCLVGGLAAAIEDFERCFELSQAAGLDSVTRAAAEYSALARAMAGDTTGARAALRRSRGFSRALVALQFVDSHLDQLVGALVALDQLDLQTARLLLPPAGETHRRAAPPAWFVEAYVRAHIGLLTGDLFSATTGLSAVLRDRRTSLQRGTLSSQLLTATAATINVWGGNTTRAKNILDSIPCNPMIDAVHAEVALQMGDVQGALSITDASLEADPAAVPGRLRIETLVTRAVARARQGDDAGAAADLSQAIDLADPLLLRPFLVVPRELLADLAEQLPAVASLLSRLEDSGITLTPVEHQVLVVLTEAEQDLLRALDAGDSIEVLATRLGITIPQALTAVGDLFASLGVNDRLGAIAAGHMLGYLGTPRS